MTERSITRRHVGEKPELVIGWLLAADLRDPKLLAAYEEARARLQALLQNQFPEFDWRMPFVERRTFSPRGALKLLPLLEAGAEEKLYRRWDFALVVVPNDLAPRRRIRTLGVPSSALEVAALSSALLGSGEGLVERTAALALHLLGHLLGFETADEGGEGPMRAPEPDRLRLEPFPDAQREEVLERLHEVTDVRLEEKTTRWNALSFYWHALLADPFSIVRSIIGYAPWRIPLYLGRLTATVAVSLLFLLLTAESWEAGAHIRPLWLSVGVAVSVVAASLFVFLGQHLDQVGRGRGWSEQMARSRIVLLGTLFAGMVSLWVVLFAILFIVSLALPVNVTAGWAGFEPATLPRVKYVAFMASIGILAAALGGNLEEEDAIKAELFFDEEV